MNRHIGKIILYTKLCKLMIPEGVSQPLHYWRIHNQMLIADWLVTVMRPSRFPVSFCSDAMERESLCQLEMIVIKFYLFTPLKTTLEKKHRESP